MKDDNPAQNSRRASMRIAELVRRLAEVEGAIDATLASQIDAVIDPASSRPILLRHAQEALGASEARYDRLMARLAALIFELEPDGTILFVSETANRLTGYSPEELLGRSWWNIFFPAERSPEADALRQKLQAGDVLHHKVTLTTRDGSPIILDLSSANHYSDGRILEKIVGLGIDITQRKQAEREQAAKAAAEEADAFKLRFLTMLSHELRAPLASIQEVTTTMLAPTAQWDTQEAQELLRSIDARIDRLAEFVEELMDISRIQAGVSHITLEPLAFNSVIDAASSRLHAVTGDHHLQLGIPKKLPMVQADSRRIAQVLVNLVENAARYSPPGAPIVLSAKSVEDAVQIDVSNEGQGIPLGARNAVFEPFHQLGPSSSPHQKGAGLGLAICKGLVEAHGGKIWIGEQPGPGTTVSFVLPCAK